MMPSFVITCAAEKAVRQPLIAYLRESKLNMVFQLRAAFTLHLAAECCRAGTLHLPQDEINFCRGLLCHAGGKVG